MKYLMFLFVLMFAGVTNAMDCEKVPTCEELGYTTEEDPNCAPNGYMYCPFDKTYKKCVNMDCEKLGFTTSDKTSWCADLIECRGNSQMTLCQKACVATDAQSLAELASSGKCKVVTMKNDITLSDNQTITLATNTTLDGGGYTLNTEKNNLTLADGSVLQNLNIHRKPTSSESLYFIIVNSHSTFENVSLLYEITKTDDGWHYLCNIVGSLTIKDKLKIEVINTARHAILNGGEVLFENAKVELIGASNALVQQKSITANNSEIYIKGSEYALNTTSPELINSQMVIDSTQVCYANPGEDKHCSITLKDGSTLNTKTSDFLSLKKIIFSGTSEKPAKAVIQKEGRTTLDVQNTGAELEYMGTTYRPKQIGTTLLSDVPTSPNWEKMP